MIYRVKTTEVVENEFFVEAPDHGDAMFQARMITGLDEDTEIEIEEGGLDVTLKAGDGLTTSPPGFPCNQQYVDLTAGCLSELPNAPGLDAQGPKFKRGDRVECLHNNYNDAGAKYGRVVGYHKGDSFINYLVQFEGYSGGHDGFAESEIGDKATSRLWLGVNDLGQLS